MTGNDRRGIIVQERDRHLLRELSVMRVIDREQAKQVAGFGSTTRANCRLLALSRAGLLRRMFLGTVGGARKALYSLSTDGAQLVGVPFRGPRRKLDETLVADFFVMHQLRINDLYCTLKYAPVPAPGAKFVRWLSFYEPLGSGLALIPDGYFEVAAPAKTITAFLEVDLGHESRGVWTAKVQSYLRHAVSGAFRERFGQSQFRVLAVADSERRVNSLRNATAALTEKIFWFTTFEAIRQHGFWSPIWQRPKHDERLPLIEAL
jgi:hypothetical protein